MNPDRDPQTLADAELGRLRARVTSAVPLDDASAAAIAEKLSAATKKQVLVERAVPADRTPPVARFTDVLPAFQRAAEEGSPAVYQELGPLRGDLAQPERRAP